MLLSQKAFDRVTCVILGLSFLLNGCSFKSAPGLKQPPDTGTLDVVNQNFIEGWVWNRDQPNETVKVDLFDGTTLLGTVPADIFRKDLLKNGIGDGKHSFKYPTPVTLKDGKPHTIRAVISGAKTELRGSPKTFEHKAK